MARVSISLIQALREATSELEKSKSYQWGHMGLCNCGHLAQVVCKMDSQSIHQYALQGQGDWSEQTLAYCPTSGLPFDWIISELINFGFDAQDLRHLEKLSDPKVLAHPTVLGKRLLHNKKEDVVEYLNAWTRVLEEEYVSSVQIPEVDNVHEKVIV